MTFAVRRESGWPLPAVVAAIALVVWLGVRVVLWVQLNGPTQLQALETATAFVVGEWFDLATVAYIVAPLLLAGALLPDRWRQRAAVRRLRWALLAIIVAALLFGAVAELLFWGEFTTRFNFIAVDYLIYTREVTGTVRQSYPVNAILAGIAAVAAAVVWVLSRHVELAAAPLGWKRRCTRALAAVLLPLSSFALANLDQMTGAGNEQAAELSGNGLFSLAGAMRRNELDYDRFYQTIPQEEADGILARLGVERVPLSKVMTVADDGHEPEELGTFKRNPRNAILISVESLSAEFVGAYGSTKGLTPRMDELAARGLKFENVYATGTRTVRGLEALSIGTPPIPGQSIVRRDNNDHLIAIGQFLKLQGFDPYFVYGGYGYFDNMNAFFAGNDYRVLDRTDFPKETIPMENVWGVADEALFDNALRALDGRGGKPFFMHIMTTSNHRPFTYPAGRIDIPSPGGREGAVKYTDYAIGRFVDQARAKPWFKDTLFVVVADHCASVAGKSKLPVPGYRIPMIFYAPDMLPPGTYGKMQSQIDLPPTLLDLLGARGEGHYFGESMFERQDKPGRAFVSNYQELGYLKGGLLTVLSPRRRAEAFRIDPVTYAATPAPVDPLLLKEAIAYYQTGSRAFRSNRLRNPDYPGNR